jgi:hypothetical protein
MSEDMKSELWRPFEDYKWKHEIKVVLRPFEDHKWKDD